MLKRKRQMEESASGAPQTAAAAAAGESTAATPADPNKKATKIQRQAEARDVGRSVAGTSCAVAGCAHFSSSPSFLPSIPKRLK